MANISAFNAGKPNALRIVNSPTGVAPGAIASQYARVTRTGWQTLGETTDSYSIFTRIYLRSLSPGSMIIGSNADNGAASYPFKIDTNVNKLRFTIYDGSHAPSVLGATTLQLMTWYDTLSVRDVATDALLLYISETFSENERLDGTVTDTTTATCKNTKKMGFGHDGGLSNPGNLDFCDTRVFNRTITLSEFQDMCRNGLIDADAAMPGDWRTTNIGWWKWDKRFKDYSKVNKNDAALVLCNYTTNHPLQLL